MLNDDTGNCESRSLRIELYVVSHVGSFASEETIRFFTDACHEEQCVQTGKEVLNFGEFLTGSDLRYINVDDRDTIIAELEALRVLIGVEPLSQRYPHHDAVVFLDKEAVLASMIRVTSRNSGRS